MRRPPLLLCGGLLPFVGRGLAPRRVSGRSVVPPCQALHYVFKSIFRLGKAVPVVPGIGDIEVLQDTIRGSKEGVIQFINGTIKSIR